jgi:Xaa-Pro dipeptidase
VNSSRRSKRLEIVRDTLERERADWLLVPAGADFRWLSDGVARSTERLIALAIPRRGDPFCLIPRLESDALAAECPWLELETWADHEDAFERLSRRIELQRGPGLLLADGFRTAAVLRFAAQGRCRAAAPILQGLRAVKDDFELQLMERASSNADQVMEQAADYAQPGMTEREVEKFILDRFTALGDTDAWAIVASGPNSALPHHHSSSRRIEDNDVVLLDLGAYTGGYGSDITRTFVLGQPDPDVARVYDVVDRARQAGIAGSRDGALPDEVDHAARAVIEEAGYGPYFTHRTGHGVGLEIHEEPYIRSGNHAPLAAGMVHSVEPGVYLPGRFGVRLEDLVAVERDHARRLNHAPLDPVPPRLRR